MKKTDRRVKKTEKALAETLSTLLVNKKIQAITIRELTETADVHRSTFIHIIRISMIYMIN